MFVATICGFLVASFPSPTDDPVLEEEQHAAQPGSPDAFLGHPPGIDETSDMLGDTFSRMASKPKEQMTATILDLDVYD